jgi:hypothetical protein
LHKALLEFGHIDQVSDEVRAVVEREWPQLAPTEGNMMIAHVRITAAGRAALDRD